MKFFALTAFLFVLVVLLATPSFADQIERRESGQGPALVAREPKKRTGASNNNNNGNNTSTNLSSPSSTAASIGTLAAAGIMAVMVATAMY